MGKASSGSLGKKIALAAVAGVLAIIVVAGNIVLSMFAPLLHGFFAGADTNFGEEAQNVLNSSDEVVREVAEESMVLLKNDEVDGEAFLPRPATEKFNLFGWASTDQGFLLVGGGSGGTKIDDSNPKRVTLKKAFNEAGVSYNETLMSSYEAFSKTDADGGSTGDNSDRNMINPTASWYTDTRMQQAKEYSTTAVVVLSRWGVENGGSGELVNLKSGKYKNGEILELTAEEKAMFNRLRDYDFKVIVLLNTTNPIEMQFLNDYDDIIEACLYVGIPGQSGAAAIPKILTGKINPSGRLSDTYALDWQSHNPSYVNATPTNSGGMSLAYAEGIYIGYKWYETADAAGYYAAHGITYDDVVMYPFGYGLSYTTFKQEIVGKSWTDGEAMEVGKTYTVTVRVTNTGDVAGRDVVQLYYTAPYVNGGVEKSSINLLAFDKTAELKPQSESETESWQELQLSFTAYDLASYDDYDKNDNNHTGYELDAGDYYIKLMSNAHVAIDDTSYLTCDGIIDIDTDPVTGERVVNRFTGSTAYANMPIDGSTGVNGGVTYLSRKDAFENFSALKKVGAPTSAASNAANFNPTVQAKGEIKYDQEQMHYLITNSDGTKASEDALAGKVEADLAVNEALLELLRDWDSELWDQLLNQLSQQNVKDIIGKGGFQTIALEKIGKRRNLDSDGPAGFNSNVVNPGSSSEWTVFPAETLSGCSWSARLMYNLGRAQGAIGVTTGRQGWYAPGVNLHRSVYNSRNYEYYSEDGVLSGRLAAQTVKGAKENNLYCYVKHFAISDNGENAGNWYEWLTEQSLRENYLKAFEITVKEGGANAMMSAFNKLGAVWCGYNQALLTDVLRTEWGFRGTVITDWYQGYMSNYTRAVKAGNDLWLDANSQSPADINLGDAATAYAARQSVKGILYTYVDTYMAAKDHQDLVESGEYQDPFSVQLGVGIIKAEPHSDLFVALWVILNILLAAGIAVCILFIFLPKKNKEKPVEQPTE